VIEFVHFPPKEAGDIKLTSLSKRAIKSRIKDCESKVAVYSSHSQQKLEKRQLSNTLYGMGRAVGHVIFNAMDPPSPELANELLKPIEDDYRENVIIDPGEHTSLIRGAHFGIEEAFKFLELESGARQ
jgi:hypothetical protein